MVFLATLHYIIIEKWLMYEQEQAEQLPEDSSVLLHIKFVCSCRTVFGLGRVAFFLMG